MQAPHWSQFSALFRASREKFRAEIPLEPLQDGLEAQCLGDPHPFFAGQAVAAAVAEARPQVGPDLVHVGTIRLVSVRRFRYRATISSISAFEMTPGIRDHLGISLQEFHAEIRPLQQPPAQRLHADHPHAHLSATPKSSSAASVSMKLKGTCTVEKRPLRHTPAANFTLWEEKPMKRTVPSFRAFSAAL